MLAQKTRKGGSGAWGQMPMPPNPAINNQDVDHVAAWLMEGAR